MIITIITNYYYYDVNVLYFFYYQPEWHGRNYAPVVALSIER